MVARRADDRPDLRILAPLTLKALRRMRGVRAQDMAKAMNMSRRAYENFENGKSRLNVARIHRFATLLHADPHAILAAFEIRSPEFALRCANNKMMMLLMLGLEDFDAQAQDTIVGLDPLDLMKMIKAFFDGLGEKAKDQDGVVRQWREEKAARDAQNEADDDNEGPNDAPPGPPTAAPGDDEDGDDGDGDDGDGDDERGDGR